MTNCEVCGTPFPTKSQGSGRFKRTCSRQCGYRLRLLVKTCPTCGKVFETNKLSMRRDYCSLSCIQRSPCLLCGKIITGRKTFQGGERRFCSRACASFVNGTLAAKKKYVILGFAAAIQRLGRLACEECGYEIVEALVVHHRNHDRGDNEPTNLVTLCANCHALSHREGNGTSKRNVQLAHLVAKHLSG